MIDAATRGVWRGLEAKLRPYVARRVRSHADVDDVLQDILTRMQQGLPNLRDRERFGPWVYKVAHNAVVDHHRRLARHPVSQDATQLEPATFEEDVTAAERELATYLAPFIAMLPSPYREALTLTELEGLTQKQAAEMLNITPSGMKSRVQRARKRVREALYACCVIELDARGHVMECERKPNGQTPKGCCD